MALLNRSRGGVLARAGAWAALAALALACGGEGGTRHYEVRGTVHDVQRAQRQVLVEHEDIPGLMPAMTMSFDVANDEVAARLRPGQVIDFDLAFDGSGYVLVDFEVVGEADAEDGWVRFGDALLKSDPAPAFALVDQAGRPLSLADLAGRVLLVDFVFTTCPGPCPILTSSHVRAQKLLPDDVRSGVHFVSISVDPEHDTPEALAAYAEARGADLAHWSFLTGTPAEIDPVLKGFGVGRTRTGDEPVEHTVISYLVDGRGRIVKRYFGLQHEARDVAADLATLARSQPPGSP